MFDMRGGAVRDVLSVQSHCAVAILASKLTGTVADGIGNGRDHPFPTLYAAAHEQFLHLTLVNLLTIRHVPSSTL